MAHRDWTKTSTDELRRLFAFHENDRGTMTMAEETRRMSLVEEIAHELKSRGIDPWRTEADIRADEGSQYYSAQYAYAAGDHW